MSNDYGLAVTNASGDIMFDSRRQMDSYVVASYGNASSVTGLVTDLVFIKGGLAVKDKLVFCDRTFNGGAVTWDFKTFDPTTKTSTSVSVDYMHVASSASITPDVGDDYGLVVKSPDGSIQFDSRSIKSDAHYTITDVWRRLELNGNGTGPTLTTSSSEYVEVGRTTSVTVIIGESVSAIKFTGTNGTIPTYHNYSVTGLITPITSFRFNPTSVFIAELDV